MSAPTATDSTLPVVLFSSLLGKLATVLEPTQRPEGTVTPQAKQALLQATNDFKNALAEAKERSARLPGGELRIEEQGDVIEMLTELRDRKRQQLAEFSKRAATTSVGMGGQGTGLWRSIRWLQHRSTVHEG
ncbi:hypothetical protein FB45DRAFT_1063057 [Roridomyces roridus]|uniref:Mediator of RNA polymerase II transcription subunit 9 n=1 Tax=Roridomyces roridus TaxID=1738132 RepID=A0AAD7BDQ6_9AGAR|nr:hypothetical protein FB45DRAFT_1063057 [Roridomyces roridus]